jgi:hypothetical protein
MRYIQSYYSTLTFIFVILALSGNCQDMSEASNWSSYKNEKYSFMINYPENYFLKVSSDRYLLLKKKSDTINKWRISVMVYRDRFNEENNEFNKPYDQFTNDILKSTFCADGPLGSQYGDSVVNSKCFKNKNGIDITENYVNVVYETYENKTKKIRNATVGPVFLFKLPKQESFTNFKGRAILLESIDENEETEKVLREIVANLKFE